jgi:hypothetical protein
MLNCHCISIYSKTVFPNRQCPGDVLYEVRGHLAQVEVLPRDRAQVPGFTSVSS